MILEDVETYNRLQLIEGLLGYLEIREWALHKMSGAPGGASDFDFRVYHYLYFANVFGAVDLVRDHLGQKKDGPFEEEVLHGFDKETDYYFARGLRNAVIHRGLDPTMQSIERKGFLLALCPPVVHYGQGKNLRSYVCSVPHLVELAAICDRAVNRAILGVLVQEQLLAPPWPALGIDQTLNTISALPHMPDFMKEKAAEAIAQMDFSAVEEKLAESRARRLRTLLGEPDEVSQSDAV